MKMPYQGKQVDATSVDFITRKEDFNEYQLTDGKVLRIKLVVTRVLRVEGEKNPDGSQVYLINSGNIIAPME